MNCLNDRLFDRFGNSISGIDIRPGTLVDFGNGIYKIEEVHSKMSDFAWMATPQGHHKMAWECHKNF